MAPVPWFQVKVKPATGNTLFWDKEMSRAAPGSTIARVMTLMHRVELHGFLVT